MAIKPEDDIEAKRRQAALLRKYVDRLGAQSPGITPRWRRAIDNYRRIKSEKAQR